MRSDLFTELKGIMILLTAVHLVSMAGVVSGQSGEVKWDTRESGVWPETCQYVEISSTMDGDQQPAIFQANPTTEAAPLVVSLHTWSGGFDQKDTLAWMCAEQGYHYIHPHFRGPNNTPDACGSPLAIQDIEDAIAFACSQVRVDTQQIHIIGASGGGYATLLAYTECRFPVRSFSAWVPISDLVSWYYESVGREQKYAKDIAMVTAPESISDESYQLNSEEAWKRSPLSRSIPVDLRKDSKLFIYAGIHDGYTGSVPITHSLTFYNHVVEGFGDAKEQISEATQLKLVASRNTDLRHPGEKEHGAVLFERQFRNQVRIQVFEGGHEMLIDRAMEPVNSFNILVLGDSNGAAEDGWVNQLGKIRFQDRIYNTSVGGNTIGFVNLGRRELNTLLNAQQYLQDARDSIGALDKVVIMLGTNDCKAVFDDSLELVPQNLRLLINKIRQSEVFREGQSDIYIISPPPYAGDQDLIPKYHGGSEDVTWLQPRFKAIAEEEGCIFIDVFSLLEPRWSELSKDGIHMTEAGQILVAKELVKAW